nr:hypothetical protein BaRGS_001136 [Batillaria attramentaria]
MMMFCTRNANTFLQFQVIVYNPRARPVEWNVRIPVTTNYTVLGPNGSDVLYQYIALTFDGNTHLLTSITNLEKNVTVPASQSFHYYVGHVGNNSTPNLQASGAYIFRPDSSGLHNFTDNVSISRKTYVTQVVEACMVL